MILEALYNFSGSLVSRDSAASRKMAASHWLKKQRSTLDAIWCPNGRVDSHFMVSENHILATLKQFLLQNHENQP